MKVGAPVSDVLLLGANCLLINEKKADLSNLLDSLKSYILSTNVAKEYTEFIRRLLSSAQQVDGYPCFITFMGITEIGSRIHLPYLELPQALQPPFEHKGIYYSLSDTVALVRYLLTNTNIDFEDDPRLDFVSSFHKEFSFQIKKTPDPIELIDKKSSSNLPFKSSIHTSMTITLCVVTLGGFMLSNFLTRTLFTMSIIDVTWWAAIGALTTLIAVASIALIHKKVRTFYEGKDSCTTNDWITSSFKNAGCGELANGWAVKVAVKQSANDLQELARIIFNYFPIYGFKWDYFNVSEGQFTGIIAENNEIVLHEWGYLYPQGCDLGDEQSKENMSGRNAGPYVSQVLNAVVSRIFGKDKDCYVGAGQQFLEHYVIDKKELSSDYSHIDFTSPQFWDDCIDKQIDLFQKNSCVVNGSFPQSIKHLKISTDDGVMKRAHQIVGDPHSHIERIKRLDPDHLKIARIEIDIGATPS